MAPANTDQKQESTKFKPGQSGNPKGRPKGSRNKTTLAVQALLEGEAESLSRVAIEKALDGDMTALRLCLERVCPVPKDRPLETGAIRLPKLTADNLDKVSAAILRAVAAGKLTPQEAQSFSVLLESHRKMVETVSLDERITQLEEASR